jgi:hypothetical protein
MHLLYFDTRSPHAGAPVLIAPTLIPIEKSANQSSFVSPDLWLANINHDPEVPVPTVSIAAVGHPL